MRHGPKQRGRSSEAQATDDDPMRKRTGRFSEGHAYHAVKIRGKAGPIVGLLTTGRFAARVSPGIVRPYPACPTQSPGLMQKVPRAPGKAVCEHKRGAPSKALNVQARWDFAVNVFKHVTLPEELLFDFPRKNWWRLPQMPARCSLLRKCHMPAHKPGRARILR